MKYLNYIISTFFLIACVWVSYLIFSRMFMTANLEYAVDSQNENTLMILIYSTLLSFGNILFMGVLAMFTRFVFVKLFFADNIKTEIMKQVQLQQESEKEST